LPKAELMLRSFTKATSQSHTYLDDIPLAADWASELDIDADVIERRLFQVGE